MTFQDFLGRRPISSDYPSSISTSMSTLASADHPITAHQSITTSPPSPIPQPATALSLSPFPEFRFLENIDDPLYRPPPPLPLPPPQLHTSSLSTLEAFACSPGLSPLCSKKRVSDSDDHSSSNQHHKRQIKNRESAARSRARKQAYTNELEIEINNLKKEIERLRQEQEHQRQHQQQSSLLGRATTQLPKKHTLYRTSTAPF
ncbi:protein FD-like isoform X2 [Macadamia integrifolia]|uniref:protein FD-like isoform X2 n=1 Tax=Macadamia integrifolia TaxID=60698 RepID=UPI001C4FCD23|nr:protein FD-like isoform X2 [Macadamia integrifolia]